MTDPTTVETAELARAIRARLARMTAIRAKQALAEQCDEMERRLGALAGSHCRRHQALGVCHLPLASSHVIASAFAIRTNRMRLLARVLPR